MAVRSAETDSPVYQHFSPHRAGLPNLVGYFRELWQRREFAAEMSRAKLRGANTNTFFGQAWLLLDPMLQAGVYFVMVMIIRGGFTHPAQAKILFAHLTGSIFVFGIFRSSVSAGSKSVIGAGKVLLNTNFPRLLIPLSAVRSSFFQFLPTIPLYLLIHLLMGTTWSITMFASIYFLGTVLVFSMGISALVATLTVYFRDFNSFLPFIVRLWMYLSPVLWMPSDLGRQPPIARVLAQINPMYSMLGGYTETLQHGHIPSLHMFATSTGWAIAAVVVGFLYFISRERDFAVRVL
jgi:ABC-type polysaccharide/polyol phosphate export permease